MTKNYNSNEWIDQTDGELFISDEMFHRNAELFLQNFPKLKSDIEKALNKKTQDLKRIKRKKKDRFYNGMTAGSLNDSIKKNLKEIQNLKFEVEYKDGVLFDSPKTGGFDFALFDEEFNIINFRNYCLGKKAVFQGVEEWISELEKRDDWKDTANRLDLVDTNQYEGIDLPAMKKAPTIIGEVQFGNWALAYYDMFKVLHLDNLADLDLLIYITATGNLDDYLSEGNVNYRKMERIINEYSSILKVPIWLIGLDIKDN